MKPVAKTAQINKRLSIQNILNQLLIAEKYGERNNLVDLHVNRWLLLRRILKNYGVILWTEFIWIETGFSGQVV
jgi:hypothetical protein